jgi:hypothetical protein
MLIIETSHPMKAETSLESAVLDSGVSRVNTALNTLSMQMSIGSSASSNWILAATVYPLAYNILDFENFGNERYYSGRSDCFNGYHLTPLKWPI